jgi:hypothetical protein
LDEVFPGPDAQAPEAIRRIEESVGTLPLALKLFWLGVGSVNLSGRHPDWNGCEYLNQLIIFPPTYALYELDEFLSDQDERIRHGIPYSVPVAPDVYHKANVSGGLPYSLAVPATTDDPPLNNASPALSFLKHIEHALEHGGFPGLAACPQHNWPVSALQTSE